ncbi:MAG: hypothetical protein N2C12_14365 [Planctomycetales bacterium]
MSEMIEVGLLLARQGKMPEDAIRVDLAENKLVPHDVVDNPDKAKVGEARMVVVKGAE